ncbi:MAG: hypothetical protein RMK74_12015 [Myxococcales bacterium]|nr:hypothetical protein [Myxococcales bacterium]
MSPNDASVLVRIVPPEYRSAEFTVSRNNVYRLVRGEDGRITRRLVGQLTEGHEIRLPAEKAARFFGGGGRAALQALSAVGSIASVANLAVCAVGFLVVSRGLRRVEARMRRIEEKVDAIAERVGVIDEKVDQLLDLSSAQLESLAELGDLLVSYQTARVHRALETLEFRSAAPASVQRDEELMAAARTLHEFRLWLADARTRRSARPAPVRAELLRAEVLTMLAEARARCLANDFAFAAQELESVLEGVRAEAARMRADVLACAGVPSVLGAQIAGVEDMVDEYVRIGSWLDRVPGTRVLGQMVRDTLHGYNDLAQRISTLENYARTSGAPWFYATFEQYRAQGFLDVARVSDADVASLIVAVRLGRSLEPALALCTAMEVLGEPAKALLDSPGPADSPALVAELVMGRD